ncbi:hypothetical protein [Campylobacter ureolyticus]|uniref:Phage-Barnase-EndoU-ColicinE5/D-RelE-like nuclease domain-containing protein n=1 Tax=Campylobacter ureolyticus TaxID=827 RepID=A0A9Q4KKA8_9BACT|nr:hypothetical protein [Campylobacter ureolyticus]MCZ6159020.1 hypothetical protein [Campylobacter ureolyticus]
MSWRIADTGEVIDINYSTNRPKRLKTTINDDSITIAPNSANENLPKGWKIADENLQTPKGWKIADEDKTSSLTTPKGWKLAEQPQITSTQKPPLYNTQNQNPFINDPLQNAVFDKGEKPTPQMGEFDKRKPYTPNDFFWDVAHGVDRGYMKIGAGINKALGKASKKLGANKTADWFEDNYYRNQHLINEDNKEIKNKYVGLGGEIVGDPTIMLPLGILGKTRGFANTVKSGLAGAMVATPAGALKDYGDESVGNKQMMSNTLINALAGGGINSLLASKTGNVLVNKLANAYRGARGKERVAYSNFRRGVEVPQAPEQTNSQFFENIKNVYDDIGIDTPLPKANITPYNETFARNQAQNSEFIKGDGFRMQREPQYQQEIIYPDEIKSGAVNEAKQIPFNNEAKQIPFKPNLLPPQNLKAPITTDDIFKEAINLHKSGFKFGKDINENINLVLNKIKNDRLNTTSAKNAQVPNNELLPPPKEPLPQDEFYLNRANKYIDELEQRGLKPEYVEKLRNNHDTLFNKQGKALNNEPIPQKLVDDATYDFKSENIFTDLRKNKISDLSRHPKVFEALKNLDEANARTELRLKNFNNETFLQEKARLNADFLSKDDVKEILQKEVELRASQLDTIDKFYNMFQKSLSKKELLKMANEIEKSHKSLDDILNMNIDPILNSAKRKLSQNVYDIKITDNPIQKNKYRQILENRLNITPIKEFGTNYAEFYHNPNGAINKLLAEKKGQVAGAFYRKDLGDIDLVWGDIKIGLRKILDKHIDDFSEFGNDINAVGKALDEIISKGKLVNKNGVETIWYKKGDNFYLVGLAKGYKKVGDNKWVITSYKKTKGAIPDEVKGNTANLSAYSGKFKGELTSSHPPLTSNADTIPKNTLNNNKMKGGFTTQAMAKNIVAGGVGGGIGAYSAPEDKKLEGFIIGALGGMGASNFGGISHSAVNLVKNMIKTPKGIDKAIEKGVDKGLVGVANKFLSKEAAKTWSDIGGNVGNIKYLFANTLDKSYEKVRDSVTGELNAMFNKYVNLSGVLNQLSKKDNKAFYDFLANNGSIENLSPEIRKFANDVRNQIIKEFEYQVGAKLVDENTAKEFSGNFLSRIYENEGLKSKFKDWISSSSSAFGIDPIYKRGLEKTIGIGEYQRLKTLNKIAVKGDKGFSTEGKWILNEPYDEKTLLKMADENTKIKIRRDYTADERAKMGEVTDIARVLPQTLYKMASRRINNEFLSKTLDLAKNTDKILAPDELLPHLKELQKAGNKREIMRLGYMQIPDNDRFGVLKGKFLRRDVAYDISQKIDSFRNKNLGTKIYTDYLNAWKWAKTVGNTTGHFNNFVGNAFLMKLAGIETKELKGMVTNVGVLKDAGKFTELKMKEKLGNIKPNELMWLNENRAKFKNYELASNVGLFGRSRLNDMGIENSFTFKEDGVLRKIGKFANDMYGAEDDVARLTMFDALVKKGKTPQEAKEFTNLLMPDYTRYMPPAIRTIKDLGIAPFISWTYYVIPSVFKLAGTKTGLNNIASTFALMFAGSYLMTGINPFGKDMPDNNKGKYLPVYKKGDTVTSLKIDRVIPYAEWLNPMNFGEAPLEAMGTMATAPIAKAVGDTKNLLLNRKIPINDFTNRPVTYSNKPIGEKTYDISKYMVQQHTPLPATASNVWNFIESLARTQKQRKTNDTFVPRSTTQEIIKLLGPNLSNHSIKGLNADRKRKERQEKKRAK